MTSLAIRHYLLHSACKKEVAVKFYHGKSKLPKNELNLSAVVVFTDKTLCILKTNLKNFNHIAFKFIDNTITRINRQIHIDKLV